MRADRATLKIASIVTSFAAGGAEVLVSNLSKEFVSSGHEASIIALTSSKLLGHDPVFEIEMRRALAGAGVGTESLELTSRRNLLIGSFRLRRLIRELEPDVIHAHSAQALVQLLVVGVRVPVVYTHHNIRLTFPKLLFRFFDRIVSNYVAIGETCADLLKVFVRRPITIIRNGAPGPLTQLPRSRMKVPTRILAVGSLTAQKDYPTLVAAARRLLERGASIRVEVAGGGSSTALRELSEMAAPLRGMVVFLGTRSDVNSLMAEADLLVNSSIYEGLPITLIEAAMAGLPIVATDVGGNREVVTPRVNGALVPPGEPKLLADAIGRILDDPDEYGRLSRGSIERARGFTIEACAAKHLALYAKTIGESVQGPVSMFLRQ